MPGLLLTQTTNSDFGSMRHIAYTRLHASWLPLSREGECVPRVVAAGAARRKTDWPLHREAVGRMLSGRLRIERGYSGLRLLWILWLPRRRGGYAEQRSARPFAVVKRLFWVTSPTFPAWA